MKVLHVITINGFGGAEKLMLELLPALQKQGIIIECLIFNKKGIEEAASLIASALEQKGILVSRFSYRKILDKEILLFIQDFLKKGNYNLVHSHLKYTDLWFALLRRRNKIKIPVISTLHGYNDSYENKHGFAVNKKIYFTTYYWVTRYIYKKLDGYVLISKVVRNFYQDVGLIKNKKQEVIYHGYNLDDFKMSDPSSNNIYNSPRIVTAGRLLKRKGHRYLIEALERVLQHAPGATIHFFGSGPEEKSLKKLATGKGWRNKIFFHGYKNNIDECLKGYDIAVIPSLWEGFGLVFLDAFKAGLPVVAFDLPAGSEIIAHGENGLLAKPYSSEDLAMKIIELCKNPGLRKKIICNGYKSLTERFSSAVMAKNYIQFYYSFS